MLIISYPHRNLVCDTGKNAVFVILTDKLVKVDANRLVKSDEKSFPGQNSKLIAFNTQDGILNVLLSSSLPTNSLTLIKFNTESSAEAENDLTTSTLSAPPNVQLNKYAYQFRKLKYYRPFIGVSCLNQFLFAQE